MGDRDNAWLIRSEWILSVVVKSEHLDLIQSIHIRKLIGVTQAGYLKIHLCHLY